MHDWTPNLATSGKPRYLAIADAIAEGIRSGRLTAADRLPPQRKLARRLDINFTTVARGYLEARKRGLIESHVGRGTFVRSSARRRHRLEDFQLDDGVVEQFDRPGEHASGAPPSPQGLCHLDPSLRSRRDARRPAWFSETR
jgi:DNA-binding transcriptional regulator YhcF (GntR family)